MLHLVKKPLLSLLLLSFVCTLSIPLHAQDKDGRKKRIAVLRFDDRSSSNFRWASYKTVGEGVMEMVITELVKTGNYTVIERSEIDAIIQEQGFQQSGMVTEETAVAVGKLLGVELAVFGTVTEFGYTNNRKNVRVPGMNVRVGNNKATVAVDVRIVSVTTGEILTAEDVREEKTATSLGVDTRKYDFSDQKSFDQSIVGKAARKAVESVIKLIDEDAERIPWQAKVVIMQDGKVYINSGVVDGVQIGDVFQVYRPGQKLIDPDTGLELGAIDKKIGTIKVIDNQTAEGKASVCEIISGEGFERGDVVKEK